MNGRTSVGLLSIALSLGCAGCFTTQGDKAVSNTPGAPPAAPNVEEAPRVAKKDDGPKRLPKPATEIATGKLMESEADSEANKSNAERQAQLRDKARQAYQHALQIDPNNLDAHRCLAGLYTKSGDFERAFDIYKKAMAKHPKEANLWYELGMCHQRRKDLPESVRCFTKALEMEPENRDFMKKLGFTLAYMNQIEQGRALLTRAQGAALAHYNIARILLQQQQTELARQHLQSALRENGLLVEARELLYSVDNPDHRGLSEGVN